MTEELDAKIRKTLERRVKKARDIFEETAPMEIAYGMFEHLVITRFLAANRMTLPLRKGDHINWILARRQTRDILDGLFDWPSLSGFREAERKTMVRAIEDIPEEVFADEYGLQWIYQAWMTKSKKEVNESQRKIRGKDMLPVTQLFTEPYMVEFLLHNSLGAWWAARHPESPLVKTFTYLRTGDDGSPLAGTFPGWPDTAREVTVMDPCAGIGCFLVEAAEITRPSATAGPLCG